MSETAVKATPLDIAVWNAWIQKGNKMDRATDRSLKIAAVVIIILCAAGAASYLYLAG